MARDPRSLSLEEFKARLPLADVVGRRVRLTRRGRQHLGLCPFHKEKTPSFYVYEDDGHYHCFGCGAHGTAIDFVMATEGLSFPDALRRLSELTGVPAPAPPRGGGGGEDAARATRDEALYRANEAAARWFAGRLRAATAGAEARAYLERRGVAWAMVERFGLGYAPDARDGLKRALTAEGFDENVLVEAGLLVRPEDGGGGASFDRFRHRLMFPIHDRRGRVVGFGGRALGEARAKYLNTSETPLFQKGRLLYGLPLARQAARERGTVIVAEGYLDVIALAEGGFANAVAPLGTAITEEQLDLLWSLADVPVVCLDTDSAGIRAAHRLVERALPRLKPGKWLRFAVMQPGEDPDTLLRSRGAAALAQRINEALSLVDFLWGRERAGLSFSRPEHVAALEKRLRELTETVPDRALRSSIRGELFKRLRAWVGRPATGQKRSAASGGASRSWEGRGTGPSGLAESERRLAAQREARLLAPVLRRPEMLTEVEEELAALELSDARLDGLRREILTWYAHSGHLDPLRLRDHLTAHGFADPAEQEMSGGFRAALRVEGDVSLGDVIDEWRDMVARYQQWVGRRAEALAVERAIVEGGDPEEVRKRLLASNSVVNVQHGASGHRRRERVDD